jgi:ribosomal protein S18 acetylase RimI-like enzyme
MIERHLDPTWSEWFDGLVITNLENGKAVLTGSLVDQTALHSVLAKIRDLGLPLSEVRCDSGGQAIITVRQATPDDATALTRMLNLFDGIGATSEQVRVRMLACQQVLTTFIGEMDGQPVGFACLRLVPHLQGDEPYAELTDIYVDAPFRRHGVARALIVQVEAAARAAGASEVVVITGFDNEGAQAAYRANGYANWALAMRKHVPAE